MKLPIGLNKINEKRKEKAEAKKVAEEKIKLIKNLKWMVLLGIVLIVTFGVLSLFEDDELEPKNKGREVSTEKEVEKEEKVNPDIAKINALSGENLFDVKAKLNLITIIG